MKECTETITVLNRKHNSDTGLDDWNLTVIQGVSWFSKLASSVTQSGLKTAKTVIVRIPVDADTNDAAYMTPSAYKSAESVSGAFTLADGDIIVRAALTGTPTPAEVQAAHDDCFTIISATDNTRRPHGAHWKVVGA
jgi:hypothetical protein